MVPEDSTADAVTSVPGWWVAHLFYKVTDRSLRGEIEVAVKSFCSTEDHSVVTVAMLGHRADLGIVAIGPSPSAIRHLQSALRKAGLELADSYMSRTELSEYAAGLPAEIAQARLRPVLPPEGMTAFC